MPRAVLVPSLLAPLLLGIAAPQAAPTAPAVDAAPVTASRLDRDTVPAAGRHAAILTVTSFGRYAITVASSQGVSLQVVDRMAGPGEVAGVPGERDGRLDLFLERGEYEVVTEGHPRAAGEARIEVHPFAERNAPTPPLLIELKPVEASLDDFEQVSYWIEVTQRRRVSVEAAGRNLADLRLWKDGEWLVDAAPATQVVQPVVGQPLLVCRLSAELAPGFYQLTAYAGPSQPWAEDSGAHPLHVRFGIPRLGEAGRRRRVVGPFGIDRFVVPGRVTYYRVELPEARPASLTVGWLDAARPFRNDGSSAEISKKSLPPVAEVRADASPDRDHVVSVEAAAGQPYVLQHFELRDSYPFDGSGEYWISTVHSGHAQDSVDITAIVTRSSEGSAGHVEPFLTQVVELDGSTGWARRANLLAPLTVFVDVRETGRYQVVSRGTEARFRIEPFLVDRPPHYEPPEFRGADSTWSLDAGLYVLTAEPVKKGIAELGLRPVGLVDLVLDAVGLGQAPEARPVRAAVRFPRVTLDRDRSYVLYLNAQPEVRAGVVVRRLPLDLAEPLPVAPRPGETIEMPFRAAEPGTLRAEAENGAALLVSVDGGAWRPEASVEPGEHTAAVRQTGDDTVDAAVFFEPARLRVDTPLPPLPEAALAARPEFPVLGEGEARFFDVGRGVSSTLRLEAGAPSLFRLESTGLLATEGNLRSRTVTSFVREAQNGVGRNFLIQQYLREGDYQLTVSAQGRSAGHLGVSLSRTRLANGGFLTSFVPARASLPAGEALAYRFVITRPGEFRVRALGLGRTFRCRLEDDDGWPLVAPNGPADVTRYFEPGRYRLVILPEATEARVVTLIAPTPRRRRYAGHGPHRLPLGRRVGNVWLEPEAGAPRVPDTWQIDVPAPIHASVELTGEMQASLVRVAGGGDEPVAFVPPGRGWKGALEAGRYRLDTVSTRVNNRNPYEIAVWPEELLAGLDRDVSAPMDVPVSVGRPGLVELSSFGSADVRARLFDEAGRRVAASDDRPDDWNFNLAASLPAGRYRLRVDPVGTERAACTVSMRVPEEVEEPGLALPAAADVSPGRAAHLYPLELGEAAELVVVTVRSADSVGLALESETDGSWRGLASATGRDARLEVPLLVEPARYRLRLWSLDHRDSPVHLAAAAVTPSRFREADLARGVALTPVPGSRPKVGAARVVLERPGVLRVGGAGSRWSAAPGEAAAAATGGVLAVAGTSVWVFGDLPGSAAGPSARATRLVVSPGTEHAATLVLPRTAPAVCDLAPAGGGPLLIRVASRAGQPGVRAVETDAPARPAGAEMAVARASALTVALHPRRPRALVWPATAGAEAPEVRLETRSFARPETETMPAGSHDGALAAGQARAFALPAGPKRILLALDAGVAGVLSRGETVASVHWGGGLAAAEAVDTDADRLTLLGDGPAESRFAVELIPIPGVVPPLAPGASYERAHVSAGRLRLAVAPSQAPATLHVRGARDEVLLVGASGRVARGADLPVDPDGGTLLVRHGPGLVVSWVDRPGDEARDLWSRDAEAPALLVEPPARVDLTGPSQTLRFAPRTPVLLQVRAATRAVTLLRRGDGPAEVEVHPHGVVVDAYLPGGAAELRLRGVGGETLSGTAEVTSTPVTPAGEGLGPEVLLAAGATRLFSFTVAKHGPIGIGVRASADVVEATLLSSSGQRLGSGVVQMPTLAPGDYLLALHAPEDAEPVRARPALAGLVPPSTGPPDEVIRRYLGPESAPAAFAARDATQPAGAGEDGEIDDGSYEVDAGEGWTPESDSEGGTDRPDESEGGVSW